MRRCSSAIRTDPISRTGAAERRPCPDHDAARAASYIGVPVLDSGVLAKTARSKRLRFSLYRKCEIGVFLACSADHAGQDDRRSSPEPIITCRFSRRACCATTTDAGAVDALFAGGELRVPLVDAAVGTAIEVEIDGSDVSIALSRPMDVTILNRLPGEIVSLERLSPPFVVATLSLGGAELQAIITRESVERLALIEGLRAWAMIKAVAISGRTLDPDAAPYPRRWPSSDRTSSATR